MRLGRNRGFVMGFVQAMYPHLQIDEGDDLGVRYGGQVHPPEQGVRMAGVQAGPQQQQG